MSVPELASALDFELPPELVATEPPERRGLRRDLVRLLVARPDGLQHLRFHQLAEQLEPGDLLVVNTSATLPAALQGRRVPVAGPVGRASAASSVGAATATERIRGRRPRPRPTVVHVSGQLDDGCWVIEVRRRDGNGHEPDVLPGERLRLPGRLELTVQASYPRPGVPGARLWLAEAEPATLAVQYLPRYGRPVRYGYLRGSYPLSAYQTVFAGQPGSAEMPSASRPFTADLVVRLAVRGVTVAPVLLHCGLSSAEAGEPPAPERFRVPEPTARLVNATLSAGRRVVAAGTTVVRALESAVATDGAVRPAQGWTELVLGPDRPARVVTGLITGWHPPQASHLLLLEAVAGPELIRSAYAEALRTGYRWHEFGDSALLLP